MNTLLTRRMTRAFERMLDAKTLAWECRWAEVYFRLLTELRCTGHA